MWARNEPGNGRYNSNKAQQLICRSPAEIKLKMFNFKSAAGYNTTKIYEKNWDIKSLFLVTSDGLTCQVS